MWWGYSQPLDLLQELREKDTEHSGSPFEVLIIGSGDARHIIKTLASTYKHKRCRINFHVIEPFLEQVARSILLLSTTLEEGLGMQEATRYYLELMGNTLLRPATAKYLAERVQTLVDIPTQSAKCPWVNLEKLKHKERDMLESIFKFWEQATRNGIPIGEYWDRRLREVLDVRYDHKDGIFDWDYHMVLKPRENISLTPHEYRAVVEDDGGTDSESDEAPKPCIFWGKQFKKHKGRKVTVSMTTNYESCSTDTVYATKTNDVQLLSKIHDQKTNCEPIAYHRICKTSYRRHAEKLLNDKNTEWHKNRNMHARAFLKFCIFVQNNVVEEKKCYFITFLRQVFADLLVEEYEGTGVVDANIFDTHHIEKKLFAQKRFKSKIRSIMCNNKLVVAPHNVTVINDIDELQNESALQTAALKLRSQILNMEKRTLLKKIL